MEQGQSSRIEFVGSSSECVIANMPYVNKPEYFKGQCFYEESEVSNYYNRLWTVYFKLPEKQDVYALRKQTYVYGKDTNVTCVEVQ